MDRLYYTTVLKPGQGWFDRWFSPAPEEWEENLPLLISDPSEFWRWIWSKK